MTPIELQQPTSVQRAQHEAWKAARGRLGAAPAAAPVVHTQGVMLERLRGRVRDLEQQMLNLEADNDKLRSQLQMASRRPQKVVTILGAMPGTPVTRDRWRIIVEQVAAKHNQSVNDIRSARRVHEVVIARHECFYRLKNETTMSLPQIGRLMGNKDHTTVLNGIHKHEARIASGEAA